MRDMYIADKGHYLEAWDLSQIELRVIAWYCEVYYDDPTMANIFRSGQDIHEATGNYLNISRRDGKTFNFAIAYGSGAGEIAEQTKHLKPRRHKCSKYPLHRLSRYQQIQS